MIELLNVDCVEYMKGVEDNAFDLAIVDPPYGIGENWKKDKKSKFYKHSSSYKNEATPGSDYFAEMFRVSRNQIVWGANYYTEFLPMRQSWILSDKKRKFEDSHMAEGELAWTSFSKPLRIIPLSWNGCVTCEPRYGNHPHEKPVKLYQWLLDNYAEPGSRVLDTHLGSGSSAIAAYYAGLDYVGTEIDLDYFEATKERFDLTTAQKALALG